MQQPHLIYLTKFQQQSLYMAAKDERVIAARRVGKTDGLVAPYVWMASNSMPGMLGAWVAVSRQQGFGKTIPGTMAAMERMFGFAVHGLETLDSVDEIVLNCGLKCDYSCYSAR